MRELNEDWNDDWFGDMYDTILEHEEQGCNPQEVASLVNLEIDEVEEVKERMAKP